MCIGVMAINCLKADLDELRIYAIKKPDAAIGNANDI